MKLLRIFVLLATVFLAVAAPPAARADRELSFDYFYDNLSPYGDWIKVGDYGLCWRPGGVDSDWAPYTDGYWAYTDAGWTWVSYEDFGGIVYHYGRWIRAEDEGWCWVPDYDWAPAWVSWRHSDDYVGWAPLPPEARWRRDIGVSIWADREYDIGPGFYNFCRGRDFGAPVLRGVIINREENITIIRGTVNITNITYNNGYGDGPIIFNGGPRYEEMNRFSERPVPTLKLVRNATYDPAAWRNHRGGKGQEIGTQMVGNQLIVAAPMVKAPSDPSQFQGKAKRVVAAEKITRGWGGVKDPGAQQELRQEIQRQSKGLTPASAPAKPVAAAELTVVPTKGDPHATPATGGKSGKGAPAGTTAEQPTPGQPKGSTSAPVAAATPPPKGATEPTAKGKGGPKDAPVGGSPQLKPFNASPGTGKSKSQEQPTTTPEPKGPPSEPPSSGKNAPRTFEPPPQPKQQQQQPQPKQQQPQPKQQQQQDVPPPQPKQMRQVPPPEPKQQRDYPPSQPKQSTVPQENEKSHSTQPPPSHAKQPAAPPAGKKGSKDSKDSEKDKNSGN